MNESDKNIVIENPSHFDFRKQKTYSIQREGPEHLLNLRPGAEQPGCNIEQAQAALLAPWRMWLFRGDDKEIGTCPVTRENGRCKNLLTGASDRDSRHEGGLLRTDSRPKTCPGERGTGGRANSTKPRGLGKKEKQFAGSGRADAKTGNHSQTPKGLANLGKKLRVL